MAGRTIEIPFPGLFGGRDDDASPLQAAEEARRRPNPPLRRYVWSKHMDIGFTNRVNHAVAVVQCHGENYLYSVGGFHKENGDEDSDTQAQKKANSAPEEEKHFSTGPIDIQRMNVETKRWSKVDVIRRTKDPTIPIRGGEPPRRYGHTCVGYRGKIFMFGGRNDDDGSFKIVECFDTERRMWLKIRPQTDGCSPPKCRDGHACSNIGKEMFLHGGFDTSCLQFSGDLYTFDMETYTWRLMEEKGDTVPQRDFHNAVCLDHCVVVFGGRSDRFAPNFSGRDLYDSNFYEYSLSERKWLKIKTSGYQPRGRRSAAAARYGLNSVVFFGGFNNMLKLHFNDVFIYNSETKMVTEVKPYSIGPGPRRRVGCGYTDGKFIICGGTRPVNIVVGGKKQEVLRDTDEVFMLNFLPSLEELCMMVVKEKKLSTATLALHIREKLDDF